MQPELQVGMRVSLFIPQTIEADVKRTLSLSSIVEEIPNEDNILIDMPMHRGFYFPLPSEPFHLRFFFNSIPYSLVVQYEERVKREGFMLAKLRRLSPVEKHQLREHFRLFCFLPITLSKGWTNNPENTIEGIALDLSEGGMQFVTNMKVEQGDKLTINIDLAPSELINAVVVRIDQVPEGDYKYKIGVTFKLKSKEQADHIYRYIVGVQLSQRRMT